MVSLYHRILEKQGAFVQIVAVKPGGMLIRIRCTRRLITHRSVNAVERNSLLMARRKGRTVRNLATSEPGSGQKTKGPNEPLLSKESFVKELNYQITASLVRTIYKRGLIKTSKMLHFLRLLVKMFRPILGKLSLEAQWMGRRKK